MKEYWKAVDEELPDDNERVLAWLPKNQVYLPGKMGAAEPRPCIILHFAKDFFEPGTEKREKFGPHFWLGEGQSNHYFKDVTHWMPIPAGPIK